LANQKTRERALMNCKQLLSVFVICVSLLVLNANSAFAMTSKEKQQTEVEFEVMAKKILTTHYEGMVKSYYIGSDDILADNDNTYLWKKFSESRVYAAKIYGGGMSNYEYEIKSKHIEFLENIARFNITFNVTYGYNNSGDNILTKSYDNFYAFIFNKIDNKWQIERIESKDDFYLQFCKFVNDLLPQNANNYRQTVDEVFQRKVQQIINLNRMFEQKDEEEKLKASQKKSRK
jgi:hypothetical protein